jgi:hypothetical protein
MTAMTLTFLMLAVVRPRLQQFTAERESGVTPTEDR